MMTSAARAEICPTCQAHNDLPYLFCDRCGVPRLKLGHWRVTLNLMIAMFAFLAVYWARADLVLRDYVVWDSPIYVVYSMFFLQFNLALVAGMRRPYWVFMGWFALFFMAAGAFNEFLFRYDSSFFLNLITELPEEYAGKYPLVFYSSLAGLALLVFVPAYIRWTRAYGWVMAYRVVLLSLTASALVALGILATLELIYRHQFFPDMSFWLGPLVDGSKPKYDEALTLFAIVIARILVIEVFVYSSIHGYAAVRHSPRALAAGDLRKESPFVKSLVRLAQMAAWVGRTFEYIIRCLIQTLVTLSKDFFRILCVFTREFFVPGLAMTASFILLSLIVVWTRAYIAESRMLDIARIVAAIVGLIVSAAVFMGCKTRLRWGRIASTFSQLIGWLLPNLLVFFTLMSLSLYISGKVLSKVPDIQEEFPFRIGPLTIGTAGILTVLVLYVLIRKRSLWSPAAQPADGVSSHKPIASGLVPASEEPPAPKPKKKAMTSRLSATLHLEGVKDGYSRLKEKAGVLSEIMDRKPEILKQFERIARQHDEKEAQLKALESMKESLSPETYEQLRLQYTSDVRSLAMDRDRLQIALKAKVSQARKAKAEIDLQITRLEQRRKELHAIHEAGAVNDAEFKNRLSAMDAESARLIARIKAQESTIEQLNPEGESA